MMSKGLSRQFLCALIKSMQVHMVLNCDETRLCVSTDGKRVLDFAEKERSNARGDRGTTLASLLPFVTAAGEAICTFWILKAQHTDNQTQVMKFVEPKQNYPSCNSFPRFFAFTPTGYNNSDVYFANLLFEE
eukprot:c18305_g1_i1.p1 GENE.c18305_g1_i1~~c18305_g1_i1.p1  ORF type:complete len:132 (+),score=31.04 c18305_g1_i1:212-607(+)